MITQQSIAERKITISKAKTLAFYFFLFFLFWALRIIIYHSVDAKVRSEILRPLISSALQVLLMVVPVLLYLKLVDHKAPLPYLKLTANIKRGVLSGIACTATLFLFCYIYLLLLSNGKIYWQLGAADWSNLLLFSTLSEEILFRGFLLQKLLEITGFWKANLIAAVLFAAIHWPGWIWVAGSPVLDIAKMTLIIFISGLLLGYILKRTSSLWATIIVHATENLISVVILG